MVICFQCSAETKRALDSLLSSGSYEDYSDVITAAVTNLIVLDAEVGRGRPVVIEGSVRDARERPTKGGARPRHSIDKGKEEAELVEGAAPRLSAIPPAFELRDLPARSSLELAPMPDDVFGPGQAVPADRWIFGQYSKLLPAKASCRALVNLLARERSGFLIEKVAHEIAQAAGELGLYLEQRDEHHGLSRDEAVSIGFPSSGENADRSRLRYANQFVASVNKQGQLSGLLADYKLINLVNTRTQRVQLTPAGWEFALIENPVLDRLKASPQKKFCEEEQAFLLRHVMESVPAEHFAYRTVLRAIGEGRNTPGILDGVVHEHIADARKKSISSAFITTQRSGVISRMADLGLISRARDGVRVSYLITELGAEYAGRTAAA